MTGEKMFINEIKKQWTKQCFTVIIDFVDDTKLY